MERKRYRLKIATWTVVREPGQHSPRRLDSPAAVVDLARDLLHDHDDDKEHFWVILLSAQNHYLLAHMVSTGTQSSTLVHPASDCARAGQVRTLLDNFFGDALGTARIAGRVRST